MDDSGAVVAPKSAAGTRKVPIPGVLRELLIEWKLASGRSEGYAFGPRADQPFTPSAVRRRALTAWKQANEKEAEAAEEQGRKANPLQPIGLHECRHTFASLMIDAGVNAKAISTYMGHSSITITLDRYGHLFPGNEEEAAGLLDSYLDRANTAARLAHVVEA